LSPTAGDAEDLPALFTETPRGAAATETPKHRNTGFFSPKAQKILALAPLPVFSTHETCGKAGVQGLQIRRPEHLPNHKKPTKYLTSKIQNNPDPKLDSPIENQKSKIKKLS
jgi:hypothetical protein